MTNPKQTWRCGRCGSVGRISPRAAPRSPLCRWCASELRRDGQRWCAHCRRGQPRAQWAAPAAKRCRDCTRGYEQRRDVTAQRARSLACYRADPARAIYRIRLGQIARRRATRGDQIFAGMRKRIALATLVARTPGWSWTMRARRFGGWPAQLATDYRRQCAGLTGDADNADRARTAGSEVQQ